MIKIPTREIHVIADILHRIDKSAATDIITVARQRDSLNDKLAYFTECQLATVEQLKDRKSASKSDLQRQRAIADRMVDTFREYGMPDDSSLKGCPRLRELLEASAQAIKRILV